MFSCWGSILKITTWWPHDFYSIIMRRNSISWFSHQRTETNKSINWWMIWELISDVVKPAVCSFNCGEFAAGQTCFCSLSVHWARSVRSWTYMTDSPVSNQVPGVQRGHAQQQQVGEHAHVLHPDMTHSKTLMCYRGETVYLWLFSLIPEQFLTRQLQHRKPQRGAANSIWTSWGHRQYLLLELITFTQTITNPPV